MTSENSDRSGDQMPAGANDGFVREHFARNGLDWGVGDLLLAAGSLDVLGELLACVLNTFQGETRQRAVHRIVLVQPTSLGDERPVFAAIGEAIERWRGAKLSPEEEGIVSRALRVVPIQTLAAESVISAVGAVEPRSAVVIRSAATFRLAELPPLASTGRLGLPEDAWVPHLHALCVRALEAINDRQAYLVIDAGEEWPIRDENQDLLKSVEGLGVLGGGIPGSAAELLSSHLDRWTEAIRTGAIGPIQREIDALPSRFDGMKPLLHLQLLRKAGLDGLARQAIAKMPADFPRLRPADAVVVAEIALELDRPDAARRILSDVDPEALAAEFLETFLRLAVVLGLQGPAERAERLLETKYPTSLGLARHRIERAIASFDYRSAAEIASKQAAPHAAEHAAVYALVADRLDGDAPDYSGAIEASRNFPPQYRRLAARLICENALHRGRPVTVLDVVLSVATEDFDEGLARLTLRAVRDCLVVGSESGEAISGEKLTQAISAVLAVMARKPDDGDLRIQLTRTLSVESMGLRGLAILMSIALDLAKRPQKPEPLADLSAWPKPASPDAILDAIGPTLQWMSKASPVMIGRAVLPDALIPANVDSIVTGLLRFLEFQPIDTEQGSGLFEQILVCAVALVPRASMKDMDLSMIRLAAVRFALANRHQMARNYAETALVLAGDVPRRTRIAWLCHGDVYARNNNLHEALVAACCGFMADGSATPDQIWYESMLLFRIARDLGMTDHALGFLDAGSQALSQFGALGKFKVQLDTSALQLRMLNLMKGDDVDAAALPDLMADLVENARNVLDGGHQVGPVAATLGQIVREARMAGLDVSTETLAVLAELSKSSDASQTPVLEAASKEAPSAAELGVLVRNLESAQHAEDFAFDLRHLIVMAQRLLSSEEAAASPEVAAFGVELVSDLAIIPPGSKDAVLPHEVSRPLAQAVALAAATSLPVVFVGMGSEGALLRVTVSPEGAIPPVREDKTVFDRERFRKWAAEFPFKYGVDEKTFNLFHTSTEGLGVSEIPKRAAIVASTALQRIPPNILRIGDALAGEDHRVFLVPSMAWFEAVRAAPAKSGRYAAWISTEATPEGSVTLQIMAARLRDTLNEHGIDLDEEPAIPKRLAGAELAVVAAHGGLLPGGHYFHVIANDAELRSAAGRFAEAIRGAEVAVLFVCSGGRVDSHPMSNTTVGLVKYALDAGCKCVVASPWPLDSRVPSYWLPAFLSAWEKGQPVVDAVFEANQAVKSRFSAEQRDYLAMSVYGDGLRTRAPRPGN
jgi:hypothetical protein